MRTIGVLTSGGDAPGMNAAIRAVVRTAKYEGLNVYGIRRGYEGLIDGDMYEMDVSSVADILQRGGTILNTARSDRFMTEEGQKQAVSMLRTFGIDGLIVIGGDGSMRGAKEISDMGVPVMVLPGTIDNDMAYTDRTIGFDTAVNTVLAAISNIRDTSSAHNRNTVIEVMGRHCGDLAMYSGLAGGADFTLVPEVPADISALCKKVIQGRNRGKRHSIIIKSEGVEIPTDELVKQIEEMTGMTTKSVILGYIQRGGSPTAEDRILAGRLAYKAVHLLKEESASKAIGIVSGGIVAVDLADAIATERTADTSYLELTNVFAI